MSGKHYVDNKVLYTEMIKYLNKLNEAKEAGVPKEQLPRVPNYIGQAIFMIANRLSTRPNFIGYSYRDEMVSDGIENCLMYLHNFNPDKSKNPFAYFTQIIYYAFIRRIQKEQKQQYIKHKSMMNSSIMNTLVEMSPDDATHFNAVYVHMDTDKSKDLIDKFEKSNKIKKPAAKGLEKFIGDDEDGAD
jgi:hypothetical protein